MSSLGSSPFLLDLRCHLEKVGHRLVAASASWELRVNGVKKKSAKTRPMGKYSEPMKNNALSAILAKKNTINVR